MPEPVRDDLGRRWVLLAPERAARGAPAPVPTPDDPEPCDFCPGQEGKTPPETQAVRPNDTRPDTPGWTVRSFPNLYPAAPFHEVVVHTPDHRRKLEELDAAHALDVWHLYRDRVRTADDAAAVVAIVNRGRTAGGSRTHDHGQIFGLDVVPPVLAREIESCADPCAACAYAERGVVARHGAVTIAVHPAPVVADELLLLPPHGQRFGDVDDTTLASLAHATTDGLRRLRAARGDAIPFNLVLHTAPHDAPAFHWHVHVMPRTATWGGLEVGAELPIVAADPATTERLLAGS